MHSYLAHSLMSSARRSLGTSSWSLGAPVWVLVVNRVNSFEFLRFYFVRNWPEKERTKGQRDLRICDLSILNLDRSKTIALYGVNLRPNNSPTPLLLASIPTSRIGKIFENSFQVFLSTLFLTYQNSEELKTRAGFLRSRAKLYDASGESITVQDFGVSSYFR